MSKKNGLLSVLFFLLCDINTSLAVDYTLEDSPSLGVISTVYPDDLCQVAKNTQRYLTEQSSDPNAVKVGAVFEEVKSIKVTLQRVKSTLAFICKITEEDQKAQQHSRLLDNHFLTKHFDFIRWLPDKKTANTIAAKSSNAKKAQLLTSIPEDKILLTKYYTKKLIGSEKQTVQFDQALYAIPFDEEGLSNEQAEQNKSQLTRYKYTRQQVIDGVLLDNNLAKPLIWVSEEALHDVLLQGTGVLEVNGKIRYFNVHRNNGIAYDYHIGKREQARYWYFAEVSDIMGYGKTLASKIAVKPRVTFAGNIAGLGLGKLIMVSYEQLQNGQSLLAENPINNLSKEVGLVSQMGILADEGGAFDNNLFQLDYLVDSYLGWEDYYQANKQLPDYAKAWIMLVKEKP